MRAILVAIGAALLVALVEAYLRRRRLVAGWKRLRAARPPAPPPRPTNRPPLWTEGARLDGGYLVGRELGHGASGVVHVVTRPGLSLPWAAKVIRRDLVAEPARRDLLLRELAANLRVAHCPFVVRTEMFRSFGDEIAIFSELVEHGTLTAALGTPALAEPEAVLRVALSLALGLRAVHRAGLIHADVKPGNVLRAPDGTVKLADLGLASIASECGAPGTQIYRSPEQATSLGPVTGATDVWSWAVTMLAVLLGHEPRYADSRIAPYTLRELAPPPGLEALYRLLVRCLVKEPKRRPLIDDVVTELAADARVAALAAVALVDEPPIPAVGSVEALIEYAAAFDRARTLPRDPAHDLLAMRLALAKAEHHCSLGDHAGAIATLSHVLEPPRAVPADLLALAWYDVGRALLASDAAVRALHAFAAAAAATDDPISRARYQAAEAGTRWIAGERELARTQMMTAAALARASREVGTSDVALHAEILLDLARMGRELGDDASAVFLDQAIRESDALDDRGRSRVIRALAAGGSYDAARALLAASDDPRSRLLAAQIDLEQARDPACPEAEAARYAAAACDASRALMEAGHAAARLTFAQAAILAACLGASPASLGPALEIVDDTCRAGRTDACVLAAWTRQRFDEVRQDERSRGD